MKDLKERIIFDNATNYFTAKDIFIFLRKDFPKLKIETIERFLKTFSKKKYFSRSGVKYLCEIKS